MWITCLTQFVILFLIDRAVSIEPLYKVIGSAGFGRQIFQPPVHYYYLKDHSNLEEPGFLVGSGIEKNSHDKLPVESGPDGALMELQDHGLAEKKSQDQNTLGNHLFYRFPIQPQQLIYYPVHEPSIRQPQSLLHQSIVYDYPHHGYNAPKYVLQPNPPLHNSILSYVYQAHQQIPHDPANSLTNHGEESAKLVESAVSPPKDNSEASNSNQAQQSDQVDENKSNLEDKTAPNTEHMSMMTHMPAMTNKSDENMETNMKNVKTGMSTEGSTAKMMQ